MIASTVLILCGAVAGCLICWLALRSQAATLRQRLAGDEQQLVALGDQLATANQSNLGLRESNTRLETTLAFERQATQEKLALLNQATTDLRDAFKALCADALKDNNESFLKLAQARLQTFQAQAEGSLEQRQQAVEGLVAPIRESLSRFDAQIAELENKRSQAYGTLSEQIRSLITTQENLRSETGRLVTALRAPSVRGRWGEIQLRRVVEIAGMVPYCDFVEQASVTTEDGRLRPDLIVRLPGEKNVVVDSKAPLQAYLEAIEAKDETVRAARLADHARQIRDHMTKLSSKGYWEQFEPTPEFVVMFLPGEAFFSAALEQDPGLIEAGVAQRVVPASPTTLIALLRAVAYGWRQEKIAEGAQEISNLGRELYDRLCTMAGHVEDVGKGLNRAVDSYNKAVSSLETRVLVSARRFKELGAAVKEELPELEPVEKRARKLQSLDPPNLEQHPEELVDVTASRSD